MENKFTIIVPCYNEETVIKETIEKLLNLLNELILQLKISKESLILLVNDGSSDKTQEIIEEYTKNNKHISCIKLTNNFGHQAALMAGINSVNSSVTITIDADLQDDYTIIKDMIIKYQEGYDIVFGVRNKRSSDTFIKKSTAELFYKFMKAIGVNIIYNHADFRLLSSKAAEYLKQYKEKNLFLRGLIPQIGLKNCNVYYERKPRKNGKSKYSLLKMITFAINGITSFSDFPIRIIAFIGFLMFLFGIIAFVYSIFYLNSIVFLSSVICLSAGLLLFSNCIIGEYIYKIYKEVQNRPLYLIEKTINLE